MLEGQSLCFHAPDAWDPASKYAPIWVRAIGNDKPPDAMQGGKCGPYMNPPGAHFAYGGREVIKNDYEGLTLAKNTQTFCRWRRIAQGITTMMEMTKQDVLKPASGGYEKDGRPLYIGQAISHYAYGDKEWTTDRFSFLVFDTSLLETETATPHRQSESGIPPRQFEGGAPPHQSERGYGANPPGQSGGWGANPPRPAEGGSGSLYPHPTEGGYGRAFHGPTEGGYGGFGYPPRQSEGDYGGHSPRSNEGRFGDYPPSYTEAGHHHQHHQEGHSHHHHTQGCLREWAEGITYEPGQAGQALHYQAPNASNPWSKHAPHFVPATENSIPPDAIQGGSEAGHPLYIARAFIDGGVHPGKCGPHMHPTGAHVAYGGHETIKNDYEVLTVDKSSQPFYRWERISQGITTMIEMKDQGILKPVTGGYEKDGRALYVCQAIHEDDKGQSVHPGKCGMHMPEGGEKSNVSAARILYSSTLILAHYAFGGKEKITERFAILVLDTSIRDTESALPAQTGHPQPAYHPGGLPRETEGDCPRPKGYDG
ncbi:hypothetical protein SmJEL517_g00352 [Synchytrium microbalum]|uniref:DUF3421 domain-containing protein n=1 Tax=Synchytrium microbalum TaxID=1806994 RepID=A0A507CAN5_9FUNG|nr:uncharacterized protein SmJEL517_g00352 [Synchytrium microbalum]TPX38117.1 hypothetical protein SmJEL517_g00352 [Synchytrium microbalum]